MSTSNTIFKNIVDEWDDTRYNYRNVVGRHDFIINTLIDNKGDSK